MSYYAGLQTFHSHGLDDRRTINGALQGARNATMLALLGSPAGHYRKDCDKVTNPRIAELMVTADVGPFNATGLRPAIESLQVIFADVRAVHPELHDRLGSAGMLCCRLVRGSSTAISNHSWGTAIDLKIDGKIDPRGDGLAQAGLFDLHPIFNRHGFFWGAAFGTEDAMHFEASEQLIRKWAAAGVFGAVGKGAPKGLTTGDRGPAVEALQRALNRALDPIVLTVDGIFGKDTRAAVAEHQRRSGLPVDGIASRKMLDAIGAGL